MNDYFYKYDILSIMSHNPKYSNYLVDELEPHHFYVNKNNKVITTCKHLNHIMFYSHLQKNELIGMDARLLFENDTLLKKAFRTLRKEGEIWSKELVLKRKDKSRFWVLMCFRLEQHPIYKDLEMICQFVNINDFKVEEKEATEGEDLKLSLKEKVASNDLKTCMEELLLYYDRCKRKELQNQVLIQKSQFSLITEQQRAFIISFDEYNRVLSNIRANLLSLIDEI